MALRKAHVRDTDYASAELRSVKQCGILGIYTVRASFGRRRSPTTRCWSGA